MQINLEEVQILSREEEINQIARSSETKNYVREGRRWNALEEIKIYFVWATTSIIIHVGCSRSHIRICVISHVIRPLE